YTNTELLVDGGGAVTAIRTRTGVGHENNTTLAAALMAGATFAVSPRWAIDVGYRALYTDGIDVTITTPSFVTATTQTSIMAIGAGWEHEVRVGVRFNIW